LGKDYILEAFDNCFDDYNLLSHLVHDTIKLIYDEAYSTLKEKVLNILKLLNIQDQYSDKFLVRFRLLFQEYFSVIFICNDQSVTNIREKLKAITETYKEIETQGEKVKNDIDSVGFKNFVSYTFNLCIYMILHDPTLVFNILSYDKRILTYNYYTKSEFQNIDGFAKERTPCVVILPTPMIRSNNVYQGIKPAVYIISNPTEVIKTECEKNCNLNKGRSYSSSDLINTKQSVLNADNITHNNNIMAISNNNIINNNNTNITNNNTNNNIITNVKQTNTEQAKSSIINITVEKLRENSNSESNLNNLINNLTPVFIKQNQGVFNKEIDKQDSKDTNKPIAKPITNDDQKNKNYYDHPLSITKSLIKKNKNNITNNQINEEKPNTDINNYILNTKKNNPNHSKGSSFYESYSNEIAAVSNRTNDPYYNNQNKQIRNKTDSLKINKGLNNNDLNTEYDNNDLDNSGSFRKNRKVKDVQPKTDDRSLIMEKYESKEANTIERETNNNTNYPFKNTNSSTISKFTSSTMNYLKSPLISSFITNSKVDYTASLNRKKSKII
jgi:hypothetical protein